MSNFARLKGRIKQLLSVIGELFFAASVKQPLLRREMAALREEIRATMPDNPVLSGYKIYSQTDEDGILAEIFRRIGDGGRLFVEIGCGDGSENNTHALLLGGWRGTWIDAGREKIDRIAAVIPLRSARLTVVHFAVTRENAARLVTDATGGTELDLLSVDIDGNDLHVLQAITASIRPRVIVSEYNGKFPPPLALTVGYDPGHRWAGDDYHGASIQALVDGLPGYRLVTCNLSGANAFFVRDDLAGPFTKYPIEALYQPARIHLIHARVGPPSSLKFLRDALRR